MRIYVLNHNDIFVSGSDLTGNDIGKRKRGWASFEAGQKVYYIGDYDDSIGQSIPGVTYVETDAEECDIISITGG